MIQQSPKILPNHPFEFKSEKLARHLAEAIYNLRDSQAEPLVKVRSRINEIAYKYAFGQNIQTNLNKKEIEQDLLGILEAEQVAPELYLETLGLATYLELPIVSSLLNLPLPRIYDSTLNPRPLKMWKLLIDALIQSRRGNSEEGRGSLEQCVKEAKKGKLVKLTYFSIKTLENLLREKIGTGTVLQETLESREKWILYNTKEKENLYKAISIIDFPSLAIIGKENHPYNYPFFPKE